MPSAPVQFTELLRRAQANRLTTCLLCGSAAAPLVYELEYAETGGVTEFRVCRPCFARYPDEESLITAVVERLGV